MILIFNKRNQYYRYNDIKLAMYAVLSCRNVIQPCQFTRILARVLKTFDVLFSIFKNPKYTGTEWVSADCSFAVS